MTRKDILDQALKCVNGDRDQQYGSPEDSFATISKFWSAYLGYDICSTDVAAMLALMKIARIAGGAYKDDNWIDLAGYAACGGEVQEKETKSPLPETSVNAEKTTTIVGPLGSVEYTRH